ncbi:MAG: glycosyltransferase family 2 protein [Cytophagales bacterium]|nr:glycosyltransferase family 2 protein [Cytophagales bacterium]
MLSICIPIYNFDVSDLVNSLQKQAKLLKILVEVLLIDDCSQQEYQEKNKELNKLPFVKYEQVSKNLGRSKIRNLFVEKAQFPFLLFIDCDMKVVDNRFLERYSSFCIQENKEIVVCGGLAYEQKEPNDEYLLRWKYGHNREVRELAIRQENPNQSFMSSNFLISKSLFLKLQFDETLTQYGHEDTLFGLELNKHNIQIIQIDNPLYHLGIETNEIFVAKTEKGVENLYKLYLRFQDDSDFINHIQLLKVYHKIKILQFPLKLAFSLIQKALYHNLTKGSKNLRCFDIYKLGMLLKAKGKINKR